MNQRQQLSRIVFLSLTTALLLWLAFRHVDARKLQSAMQGLHWSYVYLYLASLVAGQIVRAWRWGLLIAPFARPTRAALFRISNLGLMLNVVLPLRMGELVRPYLLHRETGAALSSGIASVIVERCLDGLLMTILLFGSVHFLSATNPTPPFLQIAAWTALAVFGCASIVLAIGLVAEHQLVRWIFRFRRRAPQLTERLVSMLRAFVDGVRAMVSAHSLLKIVLLTVAYFGCSGLGLFCLMKAFGWSFGIAAGFVVLCVLMAGFMIPSGPAFVGTFQASVTFALALFGIDASQAAAYGLIAYPLTLGVPIAFGLPYLAHLKNFQVGPMLHSEAQVDSTSSR